MKKRQKLGIKVALLLFCVGLLTFGSADVVEAAENENKTVQAEGFSKQSNLFDGKRSSYTRCDEEGVITISNSKGIYSIYIEFDRTPKEWTLTDPSTGKSVTCGTYSFLHEFVDVKELFGTVPTNLVLKFAEKTTIADVYFFDNEEVPEWVQTWNPPCEEADLLLVTSHSDDEQLFFAGVLPYYAGERGLNVQVAYVVQHFEVDGTKDHQRPHEQLDGLWTVGVRNYPVMSDFPDLYAKSENREVAFSQAKKVFASAGVSYDDFINYLTECIRRFKPLVVVSHDLDGEYGHGTHVMAAAALTEAINYATDESKYPESATKYGTWNIDKLYLHLYEENKIVMNFDVPLEHFGGKTAFQVTQDGFGCHKSQHWTWFYKWIYGTSSNPITKASDIKTYSPCLYGLYYTNVGTDVEGDDFFENVKTYEERRLEAQREKEEQERLEQERLEALALQEKLEREEAERIAKEKTVKMIVTVSIVVVIVLAICAVVVSKKRRGKHGQK